MKINLTKLLESPTRIIFIKEPLEKSTASIYVKGEGETTAFPSPYSFEINSTEGENKNGSKNN